MKGYEILLGSFNVEEEGQQVEIPGWVICFSSKVTQPRAEFEIWKEQLVRVLAALPYVRHEADGPDSQYIGLTFDQDIISDDLLLALATRIEGCVNAMLAQFMQHKIIT